MEESLLITEDVIDVPSNKDYLFEEYLQEENAEWDRWVRPYDYVTVFDQWSTSMCTLYASLHWVNGLNILEDIKNVWNIVRPQIDPASKWLDNIRHLQIRIDNLRRDWEIAWYLSIPRVWMKTPTGVMAAERRLKEIKIAIEKWYPIYTGTDRCRWTMRDNGLLKMLADKQTGHAFTLTGVNEIYQSNDKLIKFINSWWTAWGDKGYGYLKEEDIDKLFTCYVMIPKDNSEWFNKFRANKKAMELINIAKQVYQEAIKDKNTKLIKYFEKIQLTNNITKLLKL